MKTSDHWAMSWCHSLYPGVPPGTIPTKNNLIYVGSLRKGYTDSKTAQGGFTSGRYSLFNPEFSSSKFGIIRPTILGVEKAMGLFDKAQVRKRDLDPYSYAFALERTIRHYERCAHTFTSLGDIVYTPHSVTGFICRKKFPTTQSFVNAGLPMYVQYVEDLLAKQIIPLWNASGKVELQKMSKIENNDVRIFEICDVYFKFFCMQVFQGFNKQMVKYTNHLMSSLGIVFARGGYSAIMEWFRAKGDRFIFEGDVTKWDKCFQHLFWHVCKKVRLRSYHGTGMDPSVYAYCLKVCYHWIKYAYILLPTGHIYLKHGGGNPSGSVTTSYDGTIAHTFIIFYFLHVYHLELNTIDLRIKLNSDDNLGSVPSSFAHFFTTEKRLSVYRQLGVDLDVSKDKTSDRIEDHTFLGATVKLSDGRYVPQYSREKIIHSLFWSEKQDVPLEEDIAKCVSLLLLSTFDLDTFNHLRDYHEFLVREGKMNPFSISDENQFLALSVPITRNEAISFWTGLEAISLVDMAKKCTTMETGVDQDGLPASINHPLTMTALTQLMSSTKLARSTTDYMLSATIPLKRISSLQNKIYLGIQNVSRQHLPLEHRAF